MSLFSCWRQLLQSRRKYYRHSCRPFGRVGARHHSVSWLIMITGVICLVSNDTLHELAYCFCSLCYSTVLIIGIPTIQDFTWPRWLWYNVIMWKVSNKIKRLLFVFTGRRKVKIVNVFNLKGTFFLLAYLNISFYAR